MKTNRKNIHSKLFFKYLITFAVIVIIILFSIVIFLDQYVLNKFMNIFKENYTDKLNSQIETINRNVYAIKNTAYQIEMSPSNIPFLLRNSPSSRIDIITTLKSLTSTNLMIDDIAIYYNEYEDYMIASAGSMNIENYALHYMKSSWDSTRLKDEMLSNTGFSMIITEPSTKHEEKFLFISSMPHGATVNYGCIVFLINTEFMVRNLQNVMDKHSYFIIISDPSNTNSYIIDSTKDKVIQNNKSINIDTLDSDYMILKASIRDGFTYTVGINKSDLYSEIQSIWKISLFILAMITLVGIVFIYIATEKIYQPIKKISQSIGSSDGISNELHFISNSLDSLINIKDRTLMIMKDVKKQLFNNLIYNSSHDKNSVMELIDFIKISFTHDNFYVVKTAYNRSIDINLLEEQLFKAINNQSADMLVHKGYTDDFIIFLFNTKRNNIANIKNSFIHNNGNRVNTQIAIGSLVNSVFHINKSYQDASFVLNCGFFNGTNMVMSIDDILKIVNNNYSYPKIQEKNLIVSILSGSKEEAAKVAQNIVYKLKADKISPQVCRGIYVSLVNNIKNSLEAACYALDTYIDDINLFMISSSEKNNQISRDFVHLIDIFTDMISKSPNNGHDLLINKIRKFIDDNHTKYTTSLSFIANNIGMSPSYATKIFKDSTGYSIKQYIDLKRIQTSKLLITSSAKSIKDIALLCGYLDSNSFCRKFKSMEGLSPNRYRKNNYKV